MTEFSLREEVILKNLIEKYMIMYDSGIFEVFLYFPNTRVDRKYRNNRNLDIYFRS